MGDPDGRPFGLTPLMHSAKGGYTKAVEFLLTKRAHIDSVDEDGMTALHFAASAGEREVCDILIKCGADKELRDDEDVTAQEMIPLIHLQNRAERDIWTDVFAQAQSLVVV